MSIQTELIRLTNAKAAIKTAIEGKGVTVPSGTLLDGMAALIESIEAGGLSLEYNRHKRIAGGTFTVAERTLINNVNRFVFVHNVGVVPFIFVISASGVTAQNDLAYICSFRIDQINFPDNSRVYSVSSRRASSSSVRTFSYGAEIGNTSGSAWDEQYVSICQYNAGLYLNTNITYTWTAYYIE